MKSLVKRAWGWLRHAPDAWVGALILLGAFALYLRTAPPTVLDGDSAEYQYMVYILGVPHSTGYPLYILLGKLFTLLPFGDIAYRVNLFSAVCAALTAPLVYWTARRLMPRRIPALLATFVFSVAPSMWGGAVAAEIYALHLMLGTLTLFLALRWHQEAKPSDFYALALVYGLGLTNHMVIAFLAPALAYVLWLNRARLRPSMLVRGALVFLLPLLLYAYIPIRASQLLSAQDPENWKLYTREDAFLKGTVSAYYRHSLDGFINLVTGLDNRYKIRSPFDDANRLELAVSLLLQQFGIAGVVLGAAGAVRSLAQDKKVFGILLVAGVGVGGIALYLRGVSTMYYFSLAYLILALWIGFGMDAVLEWAARVRRASTAPLLAAIASRKVLVPVLLLLPASALIVNYQRLDQSSNHASRDFAQAVLRDDIATSAVVVAPWEVSQPLRYYQFVENQRPDLLVVMESPVSTRFWTMLENARNLNRPFYWVQFTPELASTPGPRWAQAVPLPLLQEPKPRYTLADARILDQVQVIGYDLEPDPPQPGKPARVLIYYRTLERMYPMYSSVLTLSDITGRLWGEHAGFPGTFYYETFRWRTGELYRDAYQFQLPADAPAGLYNLDLSWYVYNLETGKTETDQEHRVSLGMIRVGDLTNANVAHPANARVGESMSFLGWDTSPAADKALTVGRSQTLTLDLVWRADASMSESYTVFVHLIDGSGRVVADADSPPNRGLYPTDRWKPGEPVRDRHTLTVPAGIEPGAYAVEIGMYRPATGERLFVNDGAGRTDKLVLVPVNVQ